MLEHQVAARAYAAAATPRAHPRHPHAARAAPAARRPGARPSLRHALRRLRLWVLRPGRALA